MLDTYPQLQAAAAASHPLHQQAFDTGARSMLSDPVQNGIGGLRHFGRGAQVEHHAVHGRLVQDIWQAQFHRHRIADLLSSQGRLDGVGDDPGWQGRETGSLQNRVHQMGIQPQLFAVLRLADQLLAQLDIELVAMQ